MFSAWRPGEAVADVPDAARRGADLYRDSSYVEAVDAFRQATIEAPDDPRWRYNLGVSQAGIGENESALSNLSAAAAQSEGWELASHAWYNTGNVQYMSENYGEAARAYREALLRDPGDDDAKRNLELALQKLAEQQPGEEPDSSQQGDNQKQGEDQEDQDQQQQQQDSDEQDQDQQDQQDQPQDQQSQENQDQQQDQQSQPQSDTSLTRDQAERILRALAAEEARLRNQARRMQAMPAPAGKDW
jgi:Ca-activated chloride channel family protein